jgi:hypothetical protein
VKQLRHGMRKRNKIYLLFIFNASNTPKRTSIKTKPPTAISFAGDIVLVRCGCVFRDGFNLRKHQSRLRLCVEKIFTGKNENASNSAFASSNSAFASSNSAFASSNSAFASSKSTFASSKSILRDVKNRTESSKISSKTCEYCLHVFYDKSNKAKHQKICKHRNETRLLEIEMNVKITIPEDKTECRFCKKAMFRTDALSKHIQVCKDRLKYHEELLKEKNKEKEEKEIQIYENPQTVVNNGTIINGTTINNNGTINNNTINIFGTPRSLEHIEVERIVQFLRDLKKEHITNQTYDQAGELVIMMEKYIQENEANRNFVIPDYRSAIGYIKQEKDWEIVNVEKPLSIQFKETAGILCDKKEEIDNVNDKVFKNNTNCEIFQHVKHFNNKGFEHVMYGDQKLKVIKSKYKLTKLKNKSICDF